MNRPPAVTWLVAWTLLSLACAPAAEPANPTPPPVTADAPVPEGLTPRFTLRTLDGESVAHQTLHGRMSLVALTATYDTASQAQARFLKAVAHHHVPRVNALLIVLEPPHHEPLVRTFAESLALPFPVALVSPEAWSANNPFGDLHHIPSVVLLDRDGRLVWQHLGLVDDKALSAAIRQYDDRASAASGTP